MGVSSFFMMDENFLLNRPRAMQMLDLMKRNGKSWALYVFSSVNAIRKYTMQELVELGVSWIWVGLESPNSTYTKLKTPTRRRWRRSCGSTASRCSARPSSDWSTTRPENIRREIEYAVAHNTDFHQFMLYTPVPGTPLIQMQRGTHARRGSGRHPWAVQVQLQACGHLARRFPALPRLGVQAAISIRTVPASTASARPCSRAGSATRIPRFTRAPALHGGSREAQGHL